MKTKRNPRLKSASALLVSLFLMTILAVSIGGYLTYTEQQTFLGMRAQAWNMAMAVSEAGIEEGLQQLNNNWTDLSTDGWSANGSVYSMSRTFDNGNTYTVSIDFADTMSPYVTSRASVNGYNFAQSAPSFMFAVGGVNVTATNRNLSRAVKVKTSRSALFTGAMIARHQIDMNGNNVTTDSLDSADSAKSTNGRYDPTKAGDHGDVASNDGVVNTVSIGNANIYGRVYTGPGGTATVGINGGVGEHSWQAANDGIQPGWYYNNANFTFPKISLPYDSGLNPGPQDVLVISGSTSNSTSYANVTTLPNPAPGEVVGPISTNVIRSTSSAHPGNQPGLTTNTTWNTSSTYPGSQTGLTTNFTGFTTVVAYPGPQPQMTTNCLGIAVKVKDAPTVYCGQAPWHTGNDDNWFWYYPVASYTYANNFTFSYPTYTYTYLTYTYTYAVYTSTPLYSTNHYDHVLENGDYLTTDLGGKTIVTGTARLVLPEGLKMSGLDELTIAPGGSLTVYSGGDSMTIGGNGVFNKSGYAANLIMYATPSVQSFTFNGNGEFSGVLVAPEADLRMNGGGTGLDDFTGSLLVNSVKMNGHFNFHYDEALSRLNNTGRFIIVSWDEVK
jgi:hypothetical protein